jgi:hypothetical protein
MAIPGPLDAIANISITLYGSGQMQIQGNILDPKLATTMLNHALDAVKRQLQRREKLVLPDVDVDVNPILPLTPYGDAPKDWQGQLIKDTQGGVRP